MSSNPVILVELCDPQCREENIYRLVSAIGLLLSADSVKTNGTTSAISLNKRVTGWLRTVYISFFFLYCNCRPTGKYHWSRIVIWSRIVNGRTFHCLGWMAAHNPFIPPIIP